MEKGAIYRWKPRNGTGVIELHDGTLAWFHLSAVHGESITSIEEGMPVDVEIEHVQQGDYACRATRVQRST